MEEEGDERKIETEVEGRLRIKVRKEKAAVDEV